MWGMFCKTYTFSIAEDLKTFFLEAGMFCDFQNKFWEMVYTCLGYCACFHVLLHVLSVSCLYLKWTFKMTSSELFLILCENKVAPLCR